MKNSAGTSLIWPSIMLALGTGLVMAGGYWWFDISIEVHPGRPVKTVVMRYLSIGLVLLIGLSVWVGGWRLRQRRQTENTLRRRHPGQAWRWRPDWLYSTSINHLPWAITLFEVFYATVMIPICSIALFDTSMPVQFYWLTIILLLSGILMLVHAGMSWLRYRAIGQMTLKFSPLPIRVGERCTIQLPLPVIDGVSRWAIEIACRYTYTVTRRRKDSRNHVDDLWSQPGKIRGQSRGLRMLETRFTLPADLPESGAYEKGEIAWWITLTGYHQRGGKLIERAFAIPVFNPHISEDTAVSTSRGDSVTIAGQAVEQGTHLLTGQEQHILRNYNRPVSGLPETALSDRLSALDINISKDGITYGDGAWTHGGRQYKHMLLFMMCGVSCLLAVAFHWISLILALFAALAGMYLKLHRLSVRFTPEALVIQQTLGGMYHWQREIPWLSMRKAGTTSAGKLSTSSRTRLFWKLVIESLKNEDLIYDAISPPLADGQLAADLASWVNSRIESKNSAIG